MLWVSVLTLRCGVFGGVALPAPLSCRFQKTMGLVLFFVVSGVVTPTGSLGIQYLVRVTMDRGEGRVPMKKPLELPVQYFCALFFFSTKHLRTRRYQERNIVLVVRRYEEGLLWQRKDSIQVRIFAAMKL